MKIVPAIDIINGKCVRLSKGVYQTQKIYDEKPLEVAKAFEDYGVQYLHLVDLDGARKQHIVNQKILEQISTQTKLKVDFGGGLKTLEAIRIAFDSGAWKITVGSMALKKPTLFLECLERFGAEKIILGADSKNEKIATDGWLESSNQEIVGFIQNYVNKGIKEVTCTDIAKDGMLEGPSLGLYKKILDAVKINIIASGGVSCVGDLEKLKHVGCHGAIVGKAFYEGKITLKQLGGLC